MQAIDAAIADGRAKSRASLIEAALRQQLRRERGAADAEVYARDRGTVDDGDPLDAGWARGNADLVWAELD